MTSSMRSGTNVAVPTAPATGGNVRSRVSTVSKSASLSSCRSRLYPVGRPFSSVIIVVRLPARRPDFPRASSATSGFRFWGMRLEPVL